MKKCIECRENYVSKSDHDLCYDCWSEKEEEDNGATTEEHFESSLDENTIFTVYVMLYGNNEKIGYTKDLDSRIFEIKRQYPHNKLVYFREFVTETEARRFEAWLKKLAKSEKRKLIKFITTFQNKVKKVEHI